MILILHLNTRSRSLSRSLRSLSHKTSFDRRDSFCGPARLASQEKQTIVFGEKGVTRFAGLASNIFD
jgi:hypothetical protein